MLTFTFRYFLGSFLISAISPRNSTTVWFMFSYNCLSCSSWPAVPSPSLRAVDQSCRGVGTESRRLKSASSFSSLPACLRRGSDPRSASACCRVVAVSDFAKASSFSSLPRLPFAGRDAARHLIEVRERLEVPRRRGSFISVPTVPRPCLIARATPRRPCSTPELAVHARRVNSFPTVPLPVAHVRDSRLASRSPRWPARRSRQSAPGVVPVRT